MLKKLLPICRASERESALRRSCHVLLEEMMACGVGACLSCVVKTTPKNQYQCVCKEGPCFNAEHIVWK